MAVKQAARGAGTLVLAVLAFFAGSIGWAAVSGAIGGMLDSVGIVIAAETYLMLSPVVGVLTAGYVVSEVSA